MNTKWMFHHRHIACHDWADNKFTIKIFGRLRYAYAACMARVGLGTQFNRWSYVLGWTAVTPQMYRKTSISKYFINPFQFYSRHSDQNVMQSIIRFCTCKSLTIVKRKINVKHLFSRSSLRLQFYIVWITHRVGTLIAISWSF